MKEGKRRERKKNKGKNVSNKITQWKDEWKRPKHKKNKSENVKKKTKEYKTNHIFYWKEEKLKTKRKTKNEIKFIRSDW